MIGISVFVKLSKVAKCLKMNNKISTSKIIMNACRLLLSVVICLRHSVNGDFCGHSRFVLWHENLTTFVS